MLCSLTTRVALVLALAATAAPTARAADQTILGEPARGEEPERPRRETSTSAGRVRSCR